MTADTSSNWRRALPVPADYFRPGAPVRHRNPVLADWRGVVRPAPDGPHCGQWRRGAQVYVDFTQGSRSDRSDVPPGPGWYNTRAIELEPTVADILTGAAAHIETYGLNKGDYHARVSDPCHSAACASGAVHVAAGAPVIDQKSWASQTGPQIVKLIEEAEILLAEHLIRLGWPECASHETEPLETIAGWNDRDGIDGPEVARVLREVSELAR
jgi:hypothetical protein